MLKLNDKSSDGGRVYSFGKGQIGPKISIVLSGSSFFSLFGIFCPQTVI